MRVAQNYGEVAMVFQNIQNYDKAVIYYHNAINLAEDISPRPFDLLYFYSGLALNYIFLDDYNSAKVQLDKAKLFLPVNPLSVDHANYYMTLGIYYSRTEKFYESLRSLDTAIHIADKLKQPYLKSSILFQKFKSYYRVGMFGSARDVLLDGYRDSVSVAFSSNRLLYLYNLAETEAQLGNMYAAYEYMKKYATLADSLKDETIKKEIAELELKYEKEKNKHEIQALQDTQNHQQLLLEKNRLFNYFLIVAMVVLLLISLMIFIFYNNKKKRIVQDKKLHEQELKQIAQKQQINVYNAMLEGQENERRRMAQDLHDGLGGMMASVKLKMSDIIGECDEPTRTELHNAVSGLDRSIDELRRIARNMMPDTLVRFGLRTALKELCDSLKSPSLEIEFQSYNLDEDLSEPVQMTIYRIIQELLTNAVKHGKASNILVQCSQNESRIFVTVEDDGQGFDPNKINHKDGIGLKNIRNRIDYLNGKLEIESSADEGTTVNVEVNAYE